MTIRTPEYSKLVAVPVRELLEALLPASRTSDIASPVTATHVVEVVQSVNYHSGSFISTEGFNQVHCSNSNIGGWDYTCPSGVTGVMVMEP